MTVPPRPLRLAHRGDWRHAPENTIEAFLAALRVPGCDGLEFDVRLSGDGVPVVIHDETLERVQGVAGRVDEISAEVLATYGIPSLELVLETVPRQAFLDVELKSELGRAAVDALIAGRGPAFERGIVSSFQAATLERVGRLAPAWPRWLNTHHLESSTIRVAAQIGCQGVFADWHVIDAEKARQVRAAGLELAAFTVRRRPTVRRLIELGVVALCLEAAALDG